jgi:hypothetical protein
MKKLIAVATLSLALGLPSLSFASDYMALYTEPIAKGEVKDEIKGGDVEKDFTSFYISPKEWSAETSFRAQQEQEDKDSYIVFGVQVPRSTES